MFCQIYQTKTRIVFIIDREIRAREEAEIVPIPQVTAS
jgi:hypothetical protein